MQNKLRIWANQKRINILNNLKTPVLFNRTSPSLPPSLPFFIFIIFITINYNQLHDNNSHLNFSNFYHFIEFYPLWLAAKHPKLK